MLLNNRKTRRSERLIFAQAYRKHATELMAGIMNKRSADEKIIAERKWQAGLKPKQPQLPCDHGLFGDDHLQLDLVEMLQTYGE